MFLYKETSLRQTLFVFSPSCAVHVCPFVTAGFRRSLGPTQSRTQWVPMGVSPEVKRRSKKKKKADRFRLVPILKSAYSFTSTSAFAFIAVLCSRLLRSGFSWNFVLKCYVLPLGAFLVHLVTVKVTVKIILYGHVSQESFFFSFFASSRHISNFGYNLLH
jgi:hypothetical protein